MKKLLLSLVTLLTVSLNANAQSWNMIVTHADGTTDTISTKTVKNVTFQLRDKNVDQLIIKELYTSGVPYDNDASKFFQMDKGFIIYNNCPDPIMRRHKTVGTAMSPAPNLLTLLKDGYQQLMVSGISSRLWCSLPTLKW